MAPMNSSFMTITSIQKSGYDDASDEKTHQRDITAESYLSKTAQSMSARSPIGQTGSEHRHSATQKSGYPSSGP